MEPTPRALAFFEEHLAKRWAEGCQHGPRLLKEIQELGYTGCFSYLARFLARWRRKTPTLPVALETTMPTRCSVARWSSLTAACRVTPSPPGARSADIVIRRRSHPRAAPHWRSLSAARHRE